MDKKVIGIVGTGSTVGIAKWHLQGYIADGRAKVGAVYNHNRQSAEKWVKDNGLDAHVCETYEELLERVDAVDICTPNYTHLEYAKKALEADRNVLLEKPMGISAKDAQILLDIAANSRKANMMGFVYRFSNAMQALRSLVENDIGKVFYFSASMGGKRLANPEIPLEWRMRRNLSGSGALGDFGSHLLDAAFYTSALKVKTVSCLTGRMIPVRPAALDGSVKVENDDAASFSAISECGAIINFIVSRVGMDDMYINLAGQGGMAVLSLREPNNLLYWPKKPEGSYTGEIKRIEVLPEKIFDDWFRKEITAFIDAIYGENKQIPDFTHGWYVEKVLNAAECSAAKGTAVTI